MSKYYYEKSGIIDSKINITYHELFLKTDEELDEWIEEIVSSSLRIGMKMEHHRWLVRILTQIFVHSRNSENMIFMVS